MTDQTLEAPRLSPPPPPRPVRGAPSRRGPVDVLWRLRWVIGVLIMLGIGLAVVEWARTRPGYDPYGWLVWGHLTLHGRLDTNGAPSWKPLPFIFTVPYALLGHRALLLWMTTAAATSLSGAVFAARIAYRLTAPPPDRRWIGWIAGLAAPLFLFGIVGYTHFMLSSQSDTMIVGLCLGAIDCHLYGRRRWAFAFAVLAGLGRPETWAPLGLYAIWLWRNEPSMRVGIAAGVLLQPALWFGIPALTSKSWFTAGNIALKSPRALHDNKVIGEIDRFFDLNETLTYVLAAIAVGIAALRRDRTTLVLAGLAMLWVVVEIGFVLHGWPGVPRYLFEAYAVTAVLAGAAIGRIGLDLTGLAVRIARVPGPRVIATVVTVAVAVASAVILAPAAKNRYDVERADLTQQRARTVVLSHLTAVIAQLGGPARIFACGQPTTQIGLQSVLAWDLGTNTGELFWTPHMQKVHPRPVILFDPTPHAWVIRTLDLAPRTARSCKRLAGVFLT